VLPRDITKETERIKKLLPTADIIAMEFGPELGGSESTYVDWFS
jgi:hypothetical protein